MNIVVVYWFLLELVSVKVVDDEICCWYGNVEKLFYLWGLFDVVFFGYLFVMVFLVFMLFEFVISCCCMGKLYFYMLSLYFELFF